MTTIVLVLASLFAGFLAGRRVERAFAKARADELAAQNALTNHSVNQETL